MYCVYMHKNKINGKVYIGQTNNPKRRWSNNGYYYKSCPKFWTAIQKYGWNNFEHIILEDNLNKDEVDKKEKYYIQKFDSKKNGYNILDGGTGLNSYWSNIKHQKEQSIRRKKYIKNNPDSIKFFINNVVYNQESRNKQRNTLKNTYSQGNHHFNKINNDRKKKIYCIETNIYFNSLSEAAKAYNLNVSNLSTHLNHPNKRKSCGSLNGKKLHWKYV